MTVVLVYIGGRDLGYRASRLCIPRANTCLWVSKYRRGKTVDDNEICTRY